MQGSSPVAHFGGGVLPMHPLFNLILGLGELPFVAVNHKQGLGTGGRNLRINLFYTLRDAFRYPLSLPSSMRRRWSWRVKATLIKTQPTLG